MRVKLEKKGGVLGVGQVKKGGGVFTAAHIPIHVLNIYVNTPGGGGGLSN